MRMIDEIKIRDRVLVGGIMMSWHVIWHKLLSL
jgi:hypothetical protein